MFHTLSLLKMVEYTLLNEQILEYNVYYGHDKFYGQSNVGQYDKEKNRAPLCVG